MRTLKTLPLCALALIAAVANFGCGSKALNGFEVAASNPNGPVAQALTTVTAAMFEEAQPVVNAAVAGLPAELQALVQVAYVALDHAVTAAEAQGLKLLAVNGNVLTQAVGSDLADVRDSLSAAIHDQNAPAQTPNLVIQDPNYAPIPVLTIPSLSAP